MTIRNIAFILILLSLIACSKDELSEEPPTAIIPNTGLETVSIGDVGQDVVNVFGSIYKSSYSRTIGKTSWGMFYDSGFGIAMDFAEADSIDLTQPIVRMYFDYPYEGTTIEGIGLGSNMQDAIVTYGEPDTTSVWWGDGYKDLKMYFRTNSNDVITRIILE